MERCWRWFGPSDPISPRQVREAGATGVVTALHGAAGAWSEADVAARRAAIEDAGLRWSVVESIPVTPAIKRRDGDWRADTETFLASMRAVAAAGVRVVCYNFMPVLDWTRTDLAHPLPGGGLALRFDPVALAAYDVHVLRRAGAAGDYDGATLAAAERHHAALDAAGLERLERTLIAGLPGAEGGHGRADFARRLDEYRDVDADALGANLIAFLADVAPEAERLGVRLALHPDDPPRPIFGLPRVASTPDDYRAILDAVDLPANGVTFCAGSLGSRADSDVAAMARALAPRTHFVHLRRVALEGGGAFHEAEHTGPASVLIEVIAAMLAEERRRRAEGRVDDTIPMRPDHGALLTGDPVGQAQPGYSWLGRLKAMGELRGMIDALEAVAERPDLARTVLGDARMASNEPVMPD